jgi:hypothetical protein
MLYLQIAREVPQKVENEYVSLRFSELIKSKVLSNLPSYLSRGTLTWVGGLRLMY